MRTKVQDLKYERFDVEKAQPKIQEIVKKIENAKSADEVLDARKEFVALVETFTTMVSLAYIRYTLNTKDEFYLKEQDYYNEFQPILEVASLSFAKAMLATPFRKEVEKNIPATSYKSYEFATKSISEETVGEAQEENALVTEYSQLMASILCDFKGEQKPISYVRGFMEDDDREVRKQAADAIGLALEKEKSKLDDIFDRMVKVRDKMAKKMGYKDFVELAYYRMNRFDYDRDMVAKFRENVLKDLVPVIKKNKDRIAKALGIDQIMIYDNEIIEGGEDPKPFIGGKDIILTAQKMYREMNKEVGDFMDSMVEADAFDFEARENKWGGGYMCGIDDYNQPFILSNFNGSSGDVDVVTHEFGHALAQNYVYTVGDREAQLGSYETAETHSMSMEFFAWKYIDKFFKNDTRYKYKHLMSSFSFIPYGIIVDEFQHIVYENPSLTPDERDQKFLELEKKYRPYLSYEGIPYLEKGTRWQFQMHIYETPFYYIDYCLAQVVALEFLVESQKDYDDAFSRYLEHCKRGGMYGFNELVKKAGLKSPFADGALKELAEVIDDLLKKLSK